MRIIVGVCVLLLLLSAPPASRGQDGPPRPAAQRPYDPTAWWANVDSSVAEAGMRHWMRIETGLDRIAGEHPAHATRARSLKAKAQSMYEAAAGVIDRHFAGVQASWREDIDDWKKHLAKLGTPGDPKAFLDELEGRLSGETSGSEDATLLAFAPRYAERPEAELEDKLLSKVSTRGLETAKGVWVSMTLPRSWSFKQPEDQQVVVVRRSHAGVGDAMLRLTIVDLPANELKEINEQGGAKVMAAPDLITQAGGTFVEGGAAKLGGDETAWTRYIVSAASEAGAVKLIVWSLHTFHAGNYVNLQFSVTCQAKQEGDLASDDAMKARFEHYRPLFERIVGSATFEPGAPGAPKPEPPPSR